jgi:hypothetical protein
VAVGFLHLTIGRLKKIYGFQTAFYSEMHQKWLQTAAWLVNPSKPIYVGAIFYSVAIFL